MDALYAGEGAASCTVVPRNDHKHALTAFVMTARLLIHLDASLRKLEPR